MPSSTQEASALLEVFLQNVNPLTNLVHVPTLRADFQSHVHRMSPLVFAIFYAAVNSLRPSMVQEKFGTPKEFLLEKYEEGLEIALNRDDYLRTAETEVLVAFVLWLVSLMSTARIISYSNHFRNVTVAKTISQMSGLCSVLRYVSPYLKDSIVIRRLSHPNQSTRSRQSFDDVYGIKLSTLTTYRQKQKALSRQSEKMITQHCFQET
jgi:hypothetical protein